MIHKNIIIGSGFSSIGAILGLKKKREKFLVITGKALSKKNDKNLIFLPSRDFEKFKKNIYQSIKNNNLSVNVKNNFISYLGFGGLSNLWGKIFNYDIDGNVYLKNYLKKELKIKDHEELNIHKNLKLFKLNEQNVSLNKFYKSFNKSKLNTINSTVKDLKYDNSQKIFKIYLINNKILKTKKIYLCCGIFSTLKLLRSINKKIYKNRIQLNHSDMCYGIFFSKKPKFESKIGKEFIYFSKNKNKFAGRISILNRQIVRKYNLNLLFFLLYKFCKLFKIRIFVLSVLYKRPSNASTIYFKNSLIKIKALKTSKNQLILNELKKILKETFNVKYFIFKKTLVGSDFHYSSRINKNIINKHANIFCKNLYILDSTFSKKHVYFPTFQMIYESFFRTINNVSLKKLLINND